MIGHITSGEGAQDYRRSIYDGFYACVSSPRVYSRATCYGGVRFADSRARKGGKGVRLEISRAKEGRKGRVEVPAKI